MEGARLNHKQNQSKTYSLKKVKQLYHVNMKMPRIFSPMTRNKIGVKLFLLLLKENKYHNIHLEICISLSVFTAKLIILEMENPCEPIKRLLSRPDLEKLKKRLPKNFIPTAQIQYQELLKDLRKLEDDYPDKVCKLIQFVFMNVVVRFT